MRHLPRFPGGSPCWRWWRNTAEHLCRKAAGIITVRLSLSIHDCLLARRSAPCLTVKGWILSLQRGFLFLGGDGGVRGFSSCKQLMGAVSNLLTHAVDAIRAQQVDSLLHQVGAAAAQHTEAQVLQEFRFGGGGIQSPRCTDTVIRSKVGRATQAKAARFYLKARQA